MLDSPTELLAAIRLGEDSRLELKEVVLGGTRIEGPERSDLAAGMSAMANGHGGVIVLGVRDRTREVVGIPLDRLDAVERQVGEIAQDSIQPPLYCRIERLEPPDAGGQSRPVLRVEVPRSLFVHEGPSGYLVRVGSSRRKMTAEFLARMFQQRSQARMVRFDELPVETATMSDLDQETVRRYAVTRESVEVETRKLGMAVPGVGGVLRPTVAGILFAAKRPQQWLPHAYVQAVAYRGRSVDEAMDARWYQLDARDLEGPVEAQIEEACRFVSRNQRVRARKEMGRIDQPQYDLGAVFEAVVNAVAHRDYAMHGARIRLRLFSDRLELCVPGALSNTLTVECLPYRQASRNEALVALLSRCPVPATIPGLETERVTIMDRRGAGVPVILARSERLSGKAPKYEMFGDELRLTIHAAGDPDPDP